LQDIKIQQEIGERSTEKSSENAKEEEEDGI